jgi:hypothetical protein
MLTKVIDALVNAKIRRNKRDLVFCNSVSFSTAEMGTFEFEFFIRILNTKFASFLSTSTWNAGSKGSGPKYFQFY